MDFLLQALLFLRRTSKNQNDVEMRENEAKLNSKRGKNHALFCFGYLITEMDRLKIVAAVLQIL